LGFRQVVVVEQVLERGSEAALERGLLVLGDTRCGQVPGERDERSAHRGEQGERDSALPGRRLRHRASSFSRFEWPMIRGRVRWSIAGPAMFMSSTATATPSA